jgi:hypothetical protein
MKNIWLHALIALTCFLTPFQCMANQSQDNTAQEERIYLNSEEIIITDKGIQIIQDGALHSVDGLSVDAFGIFVLSTQLGRYGECRNGHSINCPRCWGCGATGCSYRCKCW